MVSKKKVSSLVCRAYKTACGHGFHDRKLSEQHFFMLVLSEISEMVEADRKNRHAVYDAVEYCEKHSDEADADKNLFAYFERDVKDTMEDELADVCIRLFDFCGDADILPHMSEKGLIEMPDEFEKIFGGQTVCEQCFSMACLVTDIYRCCNDADEKALHIGMVLSLCFEFARYHGIDLLWHIEHKMQYNESRQMKHGKGY